MRTRRSAGPAGDPRRRRADAVPRAAGPRDPRVVEDGAARAARATSSTASRSRRSLQAIDAIAHARAAQPRVRRAAHARRRRQRAHQHPGQLRRLRDAAGGERGRRAHHGARALARAASISGEHGIGITKLEYLTDGRARAVRATTSSASIPRAASTGASSCAGARPAQRVHAELLADRRREPDPRAVARSARIADSIKDCLRCGKCKPVCATHVPRANLLYSPRNKILATSLLIEAFLYEEQTRRGISLRHFDEFGDVADHCTVCHKCVNPCPVDIDFGDVSIAMRNYSAQQGQEARRTPAPRRRCSSSTRPIRRRSSSLQGGMIDWGYRAQRLAHRAGRRRSVSCSTQTRQPPATVGQAARCKAQVIHFINKPMPGGPAEAHVARAARHRGPTRSCRSSATRRRSARTPRRCSTSPAAARSGCSGRSGSRRRRCSTTSARSACCRPATCAAAIRRRPPATTTRARRSRTDNRVLFHRVANTLNYLDIKTVIVSCGTCMDQLAEVRVRQDLPRLPAARHPRVPDGEGREARRRRTACATCITTPATRR